MKQPNKVGGGARTNAVGLLFEQTTSLRDLFENNPDFVVFGDDILRGGEKVAQLCEKHKLYKSLLEPRGVDFSKILSKKLLPDEAILVSSTLYVVEKKFQSGSGSVDEKLQTCDFKRKQYVKLLTAAGFSVEYIYVLNDWFRRTEYRDVHDYIVSVGCHYYFNELPLSALGL
jgi:hypothetical protein